jgi:hypothetical protein
MTPTEHSQIMQIVRQRLERNIGNNLTEDLATGIMAIINDGVSQLVEQPSDGEPDGTTSDAE